MTTDADLIAAHHVDQVRRGLMPRSIARRDESVATFAKWLKAPLLEAGRTDVEAFLDARRIGARTRYCWITHLHGFYDWAIRDERTDNDPTVRIIRPKMRRSLPRPAATAELKCALSHANPRHRCWLLLAAYQGLRCQEIAGLRREDVLETEGLLRVVHGKGDRERILPLHPDVAQAFADLPMPRVGWVFIRPRGGPYGPVGVSQEFNKFLREVGVDATAHQLRHWFGTTYYGITHDLRATQDFMGHANPATTAIYTAFDRRAAADALRTLSFSDLEPEKGT